MSVSIETAMEQIRSCGIIAIIRCDYPPEALPDVAEALSMGGIDIVEVTLNSRDALDGIAILRTAIDDRMLIGAGTVRTPDDVDDASAAGAQFTVGPNFAPSIVRAAYRRRMLHIPGILTASEAQAAFAAGCRMVKLFPAAVQGPGYLRALRAPLDDVDFVPTGGINATNMGAYLRAGAVAVGVGSALVGDLDYRDTSLLADRAVRLASVVRQVQEKGMD